MGYGENLLAGVDPGVPEMATHLEPNSKKELHNYMTEIVQIIENIATKQVVYQVVYLK